MFAGYKRLNMHVIFSRIRHDEEKFSNIVKEVNTSFTVPPPFNCSAIFSPASDMVKLFLEIFSENSNLGDARSSLHAYSL